MNHRAELRTFIRDYNRANTGRDADGFFDAVAERFPGIADDEIVQAVTEVADDLEEEGRKYHEAADELAAVREHLERWRKIAGDASLNLEEAARAAAAKGDRSAVTWLKETTSVAARVEKTLLDRALELHPDWEAGDKGHRWIGKGKPPAIFDGSFYIDWFQRTHPHEARAIEDAVGK